LRRFDICPRLLQNNVCTRNHCRGSFILADVRVRRHDSSDLLRSKLSELSLNFRGDRRRFLVGWLATTKNFLNSFSPAANSTPSDGAQRHTLEDAFGKFLFRVIDLLRQQVLAEGSQTFLPRFFRCAKTNTANGTRLHSGERTINCL
jgi:hypothetical protein